MIDSIRLNHEGAVAPVSQQPLVRAGMLFLGSGGGLLLLEYLTWLR